MSDSIRISSNLAGVFETDLHGRILAMNTAMEKMVGLKLNNLLQKEISFLEPIAQNLNVKQILDCIDQTNSRTWNGLLLLKPKNKPSYRVEVSVDIMVQNGSNCNHLTWVIRDLRSYKEMETQLLQSQKMEAVGMLTGGIVHDFNNLINIVSGFTNLALRSVQDDYGRKCLFNILEASDRASDLVAQILSFTQKETQLYISLSLRTLIKNSMKILRGAMPPGIDLQLSMGKGHFQVLGNPSHIHQIFINLVTNSIHAMPDGGTFRVDVVQKKMNEEEAAQHNLGPGTYVQITVSDTGEGIPEDFHERIFEPFYTTKRGGEGSGLGLSVVADIIRKHAGAIQVDSGPGKGATFRIWIPQLELSNRQAVEEKKEKILGKANILLVDDEAILVEVISEGLRTYGFSVEGVSDSQKALELFQSNSEVYDLVLSDMNMPNLSGIELAAKFLEIKPDIPFILCTGYLENQDEQLALGLGIQKVLRKPMMIQFLVEEIAALLWPDGTTT